MRERERESERERERERACFMNSPLRENSDHFDALSCKMGRQFWEALGEKPLECLAAAVDL